MASSSSSKFSFSWADKIIFVWLFIDLIVHGVLESSFVYFSLTTTVAKAQPQSTLGKMLHWVWLEYGKNADAKWLVLDPCVVSVELLTCTVDTLLCAIVMYTMWTNKPSRHFWQIVLCVCELYGDWMTFVPAILEGGHNLNMDPYFFWLYTVGSNGVWVIMPLLLLYQSYGHLMSAFKAKQKVE
ncbi:hypothetical protein C9374_002448 [Naegleria lovaniensis]|uniref:EXPERA domain-containing protein n=1 Tax=Naegleria lovaniensis TaxID=51637 RepID=A0AA88GVY0_NAELO|nr:uncharacterized protein C9374_002448 [Naegleria lovaniensis]KAG2386704.1 hypothetical protein C9374_002448 [Naegleria lovaniensis]